MTYTSKFFKLWECLFHFLSSEVKIDLFNCALIILFTLVSSNGMVAVSMIYKTQPNAQMSNIFGSYGIPLKRIYIYSTNRRFLLENITWSISGAAYAADPQNVSDKTPHPVKMSMHDLAKPKSPSLIVFAAVISTFSHFMSLWAIWRLWRYSMAETICLFKR